MYKLKQKIENNNIILTQNINKINNKNKHVK